jgi:hypothetical protein
MLTTPGGPSVSCPEPNDSSLQEFLAQLPNELLRSLEDIRAFLVARRQQADAYPRRSIEEHRRPPGKP